MCVCVCVLEELTLSNVGYFHPSFTCHCASHSSASGLPRASPYGASVRALVCPEVDVLSRSASDVPYITFIAAVWP